MIAVTDTAAAAPSFQGFETNRRYLTQKERHSGSLLFYGWSLCLSKLKLDFERKKQMKSFRFFSIVVVATVSSLFADYQTKAEVLEVPSYGTPTVTSSPLEAGKVYIIEARGTFEYDSYWERFADAEWAQRNSPNPPEPWVENVDHPELVDCLDLLVNEIPRNWMGTTDGLNFAAHTYSPTHVYRLEWTGTGEAITFRIEDAIGSSQYDNIGSLEVEIVLGESDTDDDGIPDEEDADDDNDGFSDWLEEIIGTDPLDEDDVPDLDDIEGTTVSIVESLALKSGVEKNLIDKIEDLVTDVDNLVQRTNDVMALLDEIEALYKSGRISFEDLATLESLVMKLLPFREPIYYECIPEDGYLIHRFEFNEEQMIEMAESAFKAQPYANWMIDKVMTIADGMGADLGKLIGRFTLAFSSSSMARASLDEGSETMGIEIRSLASEEGKWALEFADDVAGIWKKLALGW